jgi:hypothetical protein
MSDIASGHHPCGGEPGQYEIRVNGHLAPRWAAWFDGMTLTPHDDGTTVIHGPVSDQSALHGLLRKVSDVGLTLVSVAAVPAVPAAAPDDPATPATPSLPDRHTTRRSTP